MKALLGNPLEGKLKSLSPRTVFLCGIIYILVIATVDHFTPPQMSLSLFLLLGVLFVGWGAGAKKATVVALLSAGVVTYEYWIHAEPTAHVWILVWNTGSRLLVFTGVGLLAAELGRLTRRLENLVVERTVQLQGETEQHQTTARQLAETLERFEQVANNLNEVFWLSNTSKDQMIYVSPAYERVWGRSCESLYREPRGWLDAIHSNDRPEVQRRALSDQVESRYDVEYRVVRPDGSHRWVRDRAFPVHNAEGKVYRIAGLAQDITEQKLAEEARREAEAKYRFLIDNSPVVTWIADEEGRTGYVSSNVERIFGYAPQEMCSAGGWLGRVHAEDLARVKEEYRALFANKTFDIEYRFQTRDGRWLWVNDKSVGFTEMNGIKQAHGVFLDVTNRKQAEVLAKVQRDVGLSLSLISDPKIALERLLEMVVGLEGTDAGGAYLCQAENGELELVAHSGLSPSFIEKVSRVQADTIQARLVQAGRPVYEAQQLLSPEFLNFRQSEGLRGLTILPLSHEGRVIAAICLVSHIHDTVPPQTRVVLETVAAQAAGAIARIRAEDALRQSEARLRATINSAPIVLFAVNSQGIITFEDGQALRIPGFESGANVGKSVFEVFASLPQVVENVRRALRGEEFNALLDVAGHFLDCWYLPNRDKDGNFSGFTGVATNITDRLRLERQILEISDREQARIGQDIHDGLCQQLVSLAFDANSLMHDLSAAGHPAAPKAKKIADLLDQSITEARQVSRGLFPARLELDGLPSALDDLAQIINERFQIACLFEGAGEVEIPTAEAATHLYRIAQEAVNNAVKHSQARTILIRLRREPEQIELRVEDDGHGLSETENGDHSGMGLHIMDYRARSIGAALRIASRPEGGTIVCCKLPEAN